MATAGSGKDRFAMWKVFAATVARNQRSNLRGYPWTFTIGHIIEGVYLVLVSYFAYTFLIKGDLDARFADYAGSGDYLTFVLVGGMLNIFGVSMMMNVSRALITEWREGTLEALLLTPSGRGGYFLGTAFQQLYRAGIELAAVFGAGLLAGLRLGNADVFSAAAGAFLYLLSCYSMALLLGSVMLWTRDTFLVQNTLFAVTTLLCGFQFPRQYLPAFMQAAGELFPITRSLHLLRSALLSGESISWFEAWSVLALCAIYIGLGHWSNARIEKRLFERY